MDTAQVDRPPPLRFEKHTYIVLALLIVHCLLTMLGTMRQSLTYDEYSHFAYGQQILSLDSSRFNRSTMPFSVLNATPVRIAGQLLNEKADEFWQFERIGRITTIVTSGILGYIVYSWTKNIYGVTAGILVLTLYSFEPNVIAHAGLMTTDLYATFTITAAIYFFRQFLLDPSPKNTIISAAVLGLSQLAKYTGVYLYPLLAVLSIIFYGFRKTGGGVYSSGRKIPWLRIGFTIITFLVISIIIINVGFLFNRTMVALSEYTFRSNLLERFQNLVLEIVDLPVPIPAPYIEGIDDVLARERSRSGIYMLGQLGTGDEFNGYYFLAYLLKTPIAIQALLIWSFVVYFSKKDNYKDFIENELFALGPALFFTIYFNFFFRGQIGFRLFLVTVPFLLIMTGSLMRHTAELSSRSRTAVVVLLAYLVGSVLSYFPYFLTYFNEFVLPRTNAYKYLADSNIDWGQSEAYLQDYLDEHPESIVHPDEPVQGTVIVGVNQLVGIWVGHEKYEWIREEYEPKGHIAYSYLIFEIPPQGSSLDD